MHNFTSNMQCRLMLAHACLVPNYRSDVQFICSHAVDLVKDDDSMHAKTGLEYWMVRQQNKCGQKKQYLSAAEFDIPPPLPISI